MQNWHYYPILTFLLITNSVLSAIFGCQIPLLLCATILILSHTNSSILLKIYGISLICFDYFLAFDQMGPPLLYAVPFFAATPALNQLLMPAARDLLPYALFTLAFSVQKLALEPLATGVFPQFICTFLPFCGSILVMYVILKYTDQQQFR